MDVSKGMRTGRGQSIENKTRGIVILCVLHGRDGKRDNLQVGEESNDVGNKRQFFIRWTVRVAQSNVETFGPMAEGTIVAGRRLQDAADGQEVATPSDDDVFIQEGAC